MARVTVEDCIDKVENRFDLVLLASHRARMVSSGAPITIDRDDSGLFRTEATAILTSMQDDLDSPKALAQLSALQNKLEVMLVSASEWEAFEHLLQVLDSLFGLSFMQQKDITKEQKELVAQRQKARDDKDWAISDKLRDQLKDQRLGVRDTQHGPIWYRV